MKRTIISLSLLALMLIGGTAAHAAWVGVDEAVVEKVAKEHGREAHAPLINTDQGDMLLFVFLLGGAAAGFAGGYSYRMLTEKPKGQQVVS